MKSLSPKSNEQTPEEDDSLTQGIEQRLQSLMGNAWVQELVNAQQTGPTGISGPMTPMMSLDAPGSSSRHILDFNSTPIGEAIELLSPGMAMLLSIANPSPAQSDSVDIDAMDANDLVGIINAALHGGEVTGYGGVAEMVDRILAKADGHPIRRLTITGHASPGDMDIGGERLNLASWESHVADLSRLKEHFAEDGHVILGGCRFAKGAAGDEMLYRLCVLLGVPVTAGTQVQSPFFPGLEGDEVTYHIPDAESPTERTDTDVFSPLIDFRERY